MPEFYDPSHRALQDRFDSRRLADSIARATLRTELKEMDRRFISTADMFFLSTVDADGWPTVSYKGGDPGFVRVLDGRTLAFPSYDGNGMFLSTGNAAADPRVGMLFIDFENPRRFRVHGRASVSDDDPLLAEYAGAKLIVRVAIVNAFTNCARYIHPHRKLGRSDYVPRPGEATPVAEWKQVGKFRETLPERDRAAAEALGEPITEEEYRKGFWRGLE